MTLKKFVGIAAIVVLALLVLRGCGDGQGMGRDHDDHGDRGSMSAQGVTVQATGTVKAVPDGVSFNFAISVLAQSSESAMSDASATAELVRAALEAAGVDQEDIATQNVSVYPEYLSSSTGTQTLSGYRAQQVFHRYFARHGKGRRSSGLGYCSGWQLIAGVRRNANLA